MTPTALPLGAERLVWFEPDGDGPVAYLPGAPSPQRGDTGAAAVSVVRAGASAFVSVGTQWAASDAELVAIQAAVAKRRGVDSATIGLAPTPASVSSVDLQVRDAQGGWQTVATSPSSGMPPYAAALSAMLTGDAADAATAAAAGQTGAMRVVYTVALETAVTVRAVIDAPAEELLAGLGSRADLGTCHKRIATGVARGEIAVARSVEGSPDAALTNSADAGAIDSAAYALRQLASASQRPQHAILHGEASVTVPVATPLSRAADVAAWVSGPAPAPTSAAMNEDAPAAGTATAAPAAPAPATVALGFDTSGDVPLAFVEVASDDAHAVLEPPTFSAVTLETPAVALDVAAQYTAGGPPYRTTVARRPEDHGWTLAPAAVGLAEVTLHGGAAATRGARSARVRVAYEPALGGVPDERTVALGAGNPWDARWLVATRAPDLGGVLRLDWQESTGDGQLISHSQTTTDTTQLDL